MGIRISIGKNRYLVSDEYQYWIVQEKTSAKGEPYNIRLSGYCQDLGILLDSYIDRQIRQSDIDSLKALDNKINALKREIRKWIKEDLGELKDG